MFLFYACLIFLYENERSQELCLFSIHPQHVKSVLYIKHFPNYEKVCTYVELSDKTGEFTPLYMDAVNLKELS